MQNYDFLIFEILETRNKKKKKNQAKKLPSPHSGKLLMLGASLNFQTSLFLGFANHPDFFDIQF